MDRNSQPLTEEHTGGPEGLRALTNTKAIVYDRWGWAIQTTIPAVLDYPVRSVTQSWCVFHLRAITSVV